MDPNITSCPTLALPLILCYNLPHEDNYEKTIRYPG